MESQVATKRDWKLKTEKYAIQKDKWPGSGRHILAQFNDEAILVYQAYNDQIADYAIQNQKFGGPNWSATRMTWIKTNFLWMMYRCGWGQKKSQERVLGIWLKRESFEKYLQIGLKDSDEKGTVRLQWKRDPDHTPSGDEHPFRKAIQIGLRNVDSFINGQDILLIQDLTDFVNSQYVAIKNKDYDSLITPEEAIYVVSGGTANEESNPVRLILSYKGKQKVVVLQGRDERELMDLIYQKLKVKAKTITMPSGDMVTKKHLKDLPQGTIITIT